MRSPPPPSLDFIQLTRLSVRDDELGKLLGLQSKDLQKLCGKLKEDRMLAVYVHHPLAFLVVG